VIPSTPPIHTINSGFSTSVRLSLPQNHDGVAKSPPYGVTAFFQTSTYLMYAFAPEKPPSLVGRNFCLAII
jgi:hypothetical protein